MLLRMPRFAVHNISFVNITFKENPRSIKYLKLSINQQPSPIRIIFLSFVKFVCTNSCFKFLYCCIMFCPSFVESDDFAELNMFEDLYNIAKNNDADVVKSDWFKYFTKSAKNERFYSNSKFIHNKVINIENSGDILTIPASVWSAIYKNTFLKENEIRYLETAGASYQDISFAFKTTALANRFVLTPNSYIHYRQDNEFSSVKSKGKVFAICREFEEIDSFLQDNPKIQKYVEEYKWINQYNVYMWNLERISEEYHREFIDKYSNELLNAYEKGILDKIFFQKVSKKIFNL